ncbi:MAG: phosphoserine phosphatase SerB [Hyphomicrobiaceae bacterium]|nr:MAG: phosphoserine phosphatase SerB [Hyphomicrobiaceae bacterium]
MTAVTLSWSLVVTSAPGSQCLDEGRLERVARGVSSGALLQTWWLARGDAWEMLFTAPEGSDHADLAAHASQELAGLPVDVNIIPDDIAFRRKKLLVADMDSTIIEQECIDEMADMLGLKPTIAAITERAMRGEIAFETALAERVALLRGLSEADLTRVLDERITLMPGARTLVSTMRAKGAFTALVSGGFSFFTSKIRERVGFDIDHANSLIIEGGRLTGTVKQPILGRDAKLEALRRHTASRGLCEPDTLAVGDGANDLAMIKAAGLGVAFRAKPIVAAQAMARITHGDLTALLHLQGYKRQDFVLTA